MKAISCLLIIISLAFCAQASARGAKFGDQDSIRKIQNTELKDPLGRDLYLGYRITIKYFFAGVNLTDNGYVLAVKGSDDGEYYSLTEEEINELQSQGSLPRPLPKYEISNWDYGFGYSLWIILAATLLYSGVKKLVKKKPETLEETPALNK